MGRKGAVEGDWAYCMVCRVHSIEAWGSEFLLSFFIIILALDLESASSASDWSVLESWAGFLVEGSHGFVVDGGREH